MVLKYLTTLTHVIDRRFCITHARGSFLQRRWPTPTGIRVFFVAQNTRRYKRFSMRDARALLPLREENQQMTFMRSKLAE